MVVSLEKGEKVQEQIEEGQQALEVKFLPFLLWGLCDPRRPAAEPMHSSECVMKTAWSLDVGLRECGALSKVKSYVISQPLTESQIRPPPEKPRGHCREGGVPFLWARFPSHRTPCEMPLGVVHCLEFKHLILFLDAEKVFFRYAKN